MTDITKKYRRLSRILLMISFLLNIAPIAIYSIIGLIQADLITEKVTLTATIFIVGIMSLISFVNKVTISSRIWVILIGLYICLDEFITPLIIIAVTQIIDEWFICPIQKTCRNRYMVNREIDKRYPKEG